MDQFGEQITESELEQSHITAIVANMELEDSADGMLGPQCDIGNGTHSLAALIIIRRPNGNPYG